MEKKNNSNKNLLIISGIIGCLLFLILCVAGTFAVIWAVNKTEEKQDRISKEEQEIEKLTNFLDDLEESVEATQGAEQLDEIMVGSCTLDELGLDEDVYDQLLNSYKDPFVIHVRTALDNYLAGSKDGLGALVESGIGLDDVVDGLDNFDKNYYKSEFMIYWVENEAIGGGKEITIIFKDMPDKLFTAWVYDFYGGSYELRSFRETDFSDTEVESIVLELECYIDDSKFAL